MTELFNDPAQWLPMVFATLMGLSILIYVVLDGYDLGVGVLFLRAEDSEKDRMVASIGPFWDANETWLVLAIGILLVAFPIAHGMVLTALYAPVAVMLIGLILRGVSFEFRAKVRVEQKWIWNRGFLIGSLMTALSQGYMLGVYIVGLDQSLPSVAFGVLTAICLTAAYAFIGACWLILKTEGELQLKSVRWARRMLWSLAAGFVAISVATPLASPRVFEKWFSFPEMVLLAPLPIVSLGLLVGITMTLRHLPTKDDQYAWVPLIGAICLFVLAFCGLAYSFYPYVVPDQMTIYEAASAPESLLIILFGTLFVLPVILGYSAFSYFVFRGKATELRYD